MAGSAILNEVVLIVIWLGLAKIILVEIVAFASSAIIMGWVFIVVWLGLAS